MNLLRLSRIFNTEFNLAHFDLISGGECEQKPKSRSPVVMGRENQPEQDDQLAKQRAGEAAHARKSGGLPQVVSMSTCSDASAQRVSKSYPNCSSNFASS